MQQPDKFTLRLDQEHIDFLKKEATKEGICLSAYIRRTLKTHLSKTKRPNKTKLRAVVTSDVPDSKWGCEGEETSRAWRSEESAHVQSLSEHQNEARCDRIT